MLTNYTKHAAVRLQQRGIPPIISDWLIAYGDEAYDGRGCVIRYFSNTAIREMEYEVGVKPIQKMAEYLRCYLVQDSQTGSVITIGKRYAKKHIWRH
jgi:hypothetical protein